MGVQSTYGDRAIGIEGQLYGTGQHEVLTMINQETEAGDGTDEMAFGHAVKFEGSTNDQGASIVGAQADLVAGIVLHSHAYDPDALGTVGVKPAQTLNVLRKGQVLVAVPTGCSPGDRLYVRRTAGAGEALGACENAADSTDMIDCTNQGVFLTTAAAGGLAVLEVDFTNYPTTA